MTTIAVSRDVMAADSLVTFPGQRNYLAAKLWREGASIFGAVGDAKAIAQFRRWLEGGRPPETEPDFDEDVEFAAVELSEGGIFVWDQGLYPEQLQDTEQTYAIGSLGAGAALYCMRVHKDDPVKAVVQACRICTESGLPVMWMKTDGTQGATDGD